MSRSLLIRMTDEEFNDLPNKVIPRTIRLQDPGFQSRDAINWMLIGYCQKLLSKNEPLQDWLKQSPNPKETEVCWTPGQRILHHLAVLDGQVNNGGLAQFFWNCPDLILGTREALADLGESNLCQAYEQAIERLVGRVEDWSLLREQAATDPDNFWEPFRTSYDLLDLSCFDRAYFKSYGPAMVTRLVKYVKTHKSEFIEP